MKPATSPAVAIAMVNQNDERPLRLVFRVEVEAEEGARDAEPEDDHEHGSERDDGLDLPEADRAEVARVQRQEEYGEDAGDQPAEPVDGGVLPEPLDLRAEHVAQCGSAVCRNVVSILS